MFTYEEFVAYASDFEQFSNTLMDGWKLNRISTNLMEEIYLKKLSFVPENSNSNVLWEYHILFNRSYSVPVLYFSVCFDNGKSLSLDNLEDYINPVFREQFIKDKWRVLTQQEHPYTRTPFFMLHPCGTEDFMTAVSTSRINPLVTWLSSIAPMVNLNVDLKYEMTKTKMKVLELYSGIGGMHFALKESKIGAISEVVLAVELNPVCNEVYKHNFPNTRLLNRNIVSMKPSDFNRLEPNLLLMSPPCQPFTRLGKRGDVNDARNDSLMQFIKMIPQLTSLSFILLENVAGFEISETRHQLLDVLQRSNYICEEFLLNPRQFGICNSRLRYYLLAKRTIGNKDIASSIPAENRIYDALPAQEEYINSLVKRKIHDFLEYDGGGSPGWDEYLVDIEKMYKYFSVVDVVAYDESNSCCFTRGYTRYLKGTGSVLANTTKSVLEDFKSKWKTSCVKSNLKNELIGEIRTLKFRYFTPREVARIMMFPDTFEFPSCLTESQRYKLISNSINVYVVSLLITHLTSDKGL